MADFRPFDYGNVLSTAEGIRGQRAQNALAGTQNQRMNALMGMESEQADRERTLFGQGQQDRSRALLAQQFSAIANASSPKQAAAMFISTPDFQQMGSALGLHVDQFTVDDTDTDESIREQAQVLAQALGSGGMGGSRLPAELQTFNAMSQGLSQDDQERARRIALGLDSRAGSGRVTSVNGVPTWTGIGEDGQPFQVPLSSLRSEVDAAGALKYEEALSSGRGKTQADREAQAPQRVARLQQTVDGIDNVMSVAEEALANIDFSTVGAVGALSRAVPGTDAYNLNRALQTIKANLGFDRLQQMRDTSPTGGALGQVAVQELEALQASIRSLDQAQSPAQLRRNLEAVMEHYQNWRDTAMVSMQRELRQGGEQPQPPVTSAEPAVDLSSMSDEELRALAGG